MTTPLTPRPFHEILEPSPSWCKREHDHWGREKRCGVRGLELKHGHRSGLVIATCFERCEADALDTGRGHRVYGTLSFQLGLSTREWIAWTTVHSRTRLERPDDGKVTPAQRARFAEEALPWVLKVFGTPDTSDILALATNQGNRDLRLQTERYERAWLATRGYWVEHVNRVLVAAGEQPVDDVEEFPSTPWPPTQD